MKQTPPTPCCCREFHIPWEQAFDKFGFNDGDQCQTFTVISALEDAGCTVDELQYGLHNTVICSIQRNSVEMMPVDDPGVSIGYSDPRDYLPQDIIALLDETFR